MLISEVRAGKREGSVVSTRSFGTAAENKKETWDALRRELEDIGISPEIITEKQQFIVAWFQEAVAAGRLEEEAPSDEDVDPIAHRGSWSSASNRDSNSLIKQERSSHIFEQAASKRSSCDINNLDLPPPTTSSCSATPSPGEAVTETRPAAKSPVKSTKAQKPPKVEKRSRLSVSYLLSKLRGKEGQLLEAATGGYLDDVRAFLHEGAVIEARDKDGATALIIAAERGHSHIVQLLLDHGANVNATRKSDKTTALIVAAAKDHSQIVQLLFDHGVNVNATTTTGRTALIVAAAKGYNQIVQLLLDNGADMSEGTNSNETALMNAVQHGHSHIVQLLLDNDADVNARTNSGETALYAAAKRDKTADIVQLLLDNNANINTGNRQYQPLIAAATNESVAVLQLLIDRGANTEVKDEEGRTALHCAVWYGKERSVNLLIENGAAIEAMNPYGYTALITAAAMDSSNVVKLLLEKGANIEAIGDRGVTPLHNAVKFGRADIARLLLEHGAKTDIPDQIGQTPLRLAEERNNKAVMRVLRAAEKQRSNRLRNTISN